jgi:hypothetical protein
MHKWEDNIRIDLIGVGSEDVELIHLTRFLVNMLINIRVL